MQNEFRPMQMMETIVPREHHIQRQLHCPTAVLVYRTHSNSLEEWSKEYYQIANDPSSSVILDKIIGDNDKTHIKFNTRPVCVVYIWPDSTLLELTLAIMKNVKEDVDRAFEISSTTADVFLNNAQRNYIANYNLHNKNSSYNNDNPKINNNDNFKINKEELNKDDVYVDKEEEEQSESKPLERPFKRSRENKETLALYELQFIGHCFNQQDEVAQGSAVRVWATINLHQVIPSQPQLLFPYKNRTNNINTCNVALMDMGYNIGDPLLVKCTRIK